MFNRSYKFSKEILRVTLSTISRIGGIHYLLYTIQKMKFKPITDSKTSLNSRNLFIISTWTFSHFEILNRPL